MRLRALYSAIRAFLLLAAIPAFAQDDSATEVLLAEYLAGLGDYELVSMGSSLKFCLLAEGRADFYPRLGPTSEWDTAAAQAVVEAAGGRVTDTELEPLRYNTKESLLNPHFLVFGDRNEDWGRYL